MRQKKARPFLTGQCLSVLTLFFFAMQPLPGPHHPNSQGMIILSDTGDRVKQMRTRDRDLTCKVSHIAERPSRARASVT
jgi:hypothetical protein